MKRVALLSLKHVKFVPLALVGVSALLTLSGCPGGAELEHPEKYGLTGGTTSTGSGGTTGGTTGGATGGTTGGSAGGAMLVVDCGSDTYQNVLNNQCATSGCHKPPFSAQSGLDLTPDSGLVSRIKDVKPAYQGIYCDMGGNLVDCMPASCDPNAFYVNSSNPDASWILAKIKGTQADCGDQMPSTGGPPADVATCIENLVKAVAMLPK
jgi:hypothetical protein